MLKFFSGDCTPNPGGIGIVANIEISDDEKPFYHDGNPGLYCVGFRYKGGSPKDTRNWRYDHTNFWTEARQWKPTRIFKNDISSVLTQYSLTMDDVLRKLIEELK